MTDKWKGPGQTENNALAHLYHKGMSCSKLSMCKGQFYVYSSLRHLLWNGIIFCNMS